VHSSFAQALFSLAQLFRLRRVLDSPPEVEDDPEKKTHGGGVFVSFLACERFLSVGECGRRSMFSPERISSIDQMCPTMRRPDDLPAEMIS
jgi:hypothetical protein